MNTKHGVYEISGTADDFIYYHNIFTSQGRIGVDHGYTLRDYCRFAVQYGLTHLWVLPHQDITNIRSDAYFSNAHDWEWDLKPTWELGDSDTPGMVNHLRSVYGWKKEGENRNAFYVIFLGPYCAWQWGRKPDITPKQVLWMIGSLENDLGIAITPSPGNTGKKYLESLHPRHPEWFTPPDMDLTQLPFNQSAKSLNWTRVPTEEELGRMHLVKIDKNSAFSRAGVEYKFGTCTPIPTTDCKDVRLPGIYQIVTSGNDLGSFPNPLHEGQQWVTAPILRWLYQLGYSVEVLQGWYFPDAFHVFKTWAEDLWGMRSKYTDSRRGAFKQLLNDTIGLYRSKKLEQENVFRVRPDWYAQIVGGNRAIMLQNMQTFARKFNLYPVGCAIDCILYCSDKPLAELMPDNRETLGAYKHVWQLDMTEEVKAILTSGSNVNKKLMVLNAIAGEVQSD